MLDSHDETRVIGRWENLRVEGSKLLGDAVFDVADPEAARIAGKVDRGFIRGASMGIMINEAESTFADGNKFFTITRWELLEASPVAVPSNKSALRLYAKDGKTLLKADEIQLSLDQLIKPTKTNMDKITLSAEAAKALGISKDPEASELNAAIMELSAKAESNRLAKEKAEVELNTHRLNLATALVDDAIKAGRITADKKDSFVKLATADFQQAKDLLDAIPAKETFSDKTKTGSNAPSRDDWNYMRWLKEDPKGLKAMQAGEPERFEKLKSEYSRG